MLYMCLLTLLLLQQVSQASEPRHLRLAKSFLHVREVARNSSPDIDRWLQFVGLSSGNPYCAAYVSYIVHVSKVTEPRVRSGLARNFVTHRSVPATKVLMGMVVIPAGSVVIWRRGNTIFGHVGFTTQAWKGKTGFTIEANTSSGAAGSQFDGNGVFQRTRSIVPGNAFRITDFTLIQY